MIHGVTKLCVFSKYVIYGEIKQCIFSKYAASHTKYVVGTFENGLKLEADSSEVAAEFDAQNVKLQNTEYRIGNTEL